jgi:hypothetical protein
VDGTPFIKSSGPYFIKWRHTKKIPMTLVHDTRGRCPLYSLIVELNVNSRDLMYLPGLTKKQEKFIKKADDLYGKTKAENSR